MSGSDEIRSSLTLHQEEEVRIIEVVGTSFSLGGRSCDAHDVCGHQVSVGSALIFRKSVCKIENVEEIAVKAYLYLDGAQSCHIGFLPRYLKHEWDLFYDKIGSVLEDHRISENFQQRRRSQRMCGIVKCEIKM